MEKETKFIVEEGTISEPMVMSESTARRIVEGESAWNPLTSEQKELRKKSYYMEMIPTIYAGRLNAAINASAKRFGMKGKVMSKEELEKDYNEIPNIASTAEAIPSLVGILSRVVDEQISHYIDTESVRSAMIIARSDRDIERIKKWKKEDGKAKYIARIGWGKKKATKREYLLHFLRFHSAQQYKFSRKHLLDA